MGLTLRIFAMVVSCTSAMYAANAAETAARPSELPQVGIWSRPVGSIAVGGVVSQSAVRAGPTAIQIKLSDPEAEAIDLALRGSPLRRGDGVVGYLLVPQDFASANAILGAVERRPLRSDRFAYAIALRLETAGLDWPGASAPFAVVAFRPVSASLERDAEEPPPADPPPAELLRRLLATLFVIQIGDEAQRARRGGADCNEKIPDTSAAIDAARGRFGKETYKKELAPGRKQGKWAHDPGNKRIARGQTLPFYKVELGVGCEKTEDKVEWGVGLVSLDVQFRIVLGPGAKDHEAADAGATPGGLEGTLGHETKHGDVIGEAVSAALDAGGKWNGFDWGIRQVLDDMKKKRFATKKEAEDAKVKWQKLLEERLAKLLSAAANLHTNKAGEVAPRDGSAEKLDKEKNKVDDETKVDDWSKEVKQLQTDGYKSVVKPGLFGNYP